jgi:SRSO17 transposase
MNRRAIGKLERELTEYVDSLVEGMGREERRRAMGLYVTGLLLDGERKSIEPMAARLVDSAAEVEAMRQRLQQCVTVSDWPDDELRRRLALKFDAELPGVEALVIDDTGFPKKGKASVGVARQYSGTLGRTDNCQVATSLHLASEAGSACIAMRLYLPEAWVNDLPRRKKVGVPESTPFRKKWETALEQIDNAIAWGVCKYLVLADAGYGDVGEFRAGLTARGLEYIVGVQGAVMVWPPGEKPDAGGGPRTVAEVAKSLGRGAYTRVTWREGSKGRQSSRFAAMRVRVATGHRRGQAAGEPQWLLCAWPRGEDEPAKYWLSTLPIGASLKDLVRGAKLRWRVERDYQEMKQELGLDHFEGRTWRGFHHHATLCAMAHGFLALRRALFPPEPGAVDASHGQARSPASAPTPRWRLPSVPKAHR